MPVTLASERTPTVPARPFAAASMGQFCSATVDRGGAVFDVNLCPPTVELDLVNPVVADRRGFRQRRRHRADE